MAAQDRRTSPLRAGARWRASVHRVRRYRVRFGRGERRGGLVAQDGRRGRGDARWRSPAAWFTSAPTTDTHLRASPPDSRTAIAPSVALAATPTPEFAPLSSDGYAREIDRSVRIQRPGAWNRRQFTNEGKTTYWRDASDLIIEVFENGYWLLTGRTIQRDGWEARYYAREDYERLADERGDPGLKTASVGWCCIRTGGDSRLQLGHDAATSRRTPRSPPPPTKPDTPFSAC